MKGLVIFIVVVCFSCKKGGNQSNLNFDKEKLEEKNKNSIIEENPVVDIQKNDRGNHFEYYFTSNNLDSLYVVSDQIFPNFFEADFNGDGKKDIVFYIRNALNNKRGLVFFHSKNDYHIVGGGDESTALANILYTEFSIDRTKIVYETVIDSSTGDIIEPKRIEIKNIALHMHEEEGTSGILTWNGKNYIYIHTGD